MKNTARARIAHGVLERAQVRTLGAIRPLSALTAIRLDALASELGFTVEEIATLPGFPNSIDTHVGFEDAAVIIRAALDRLADPARILAVHAQREFDDMVWATDLATWIGVPLSEIWFRDTWGWDWVAAAAENDGADAYDVVQEGVDYDQIVAQFEGSQAAWDAFSSFAEMSDQGWIGYVDAKRIADDLGVELPWPARAIIAAMDAEE